MQADRQKLQLQRRTRPRQRLDRQLQQHAHPLRRRVLVEARALRIADRVDKRAGREVREGPVQ